MLTVDQLEELFYTATCLCLQLDPAADASQAAVRRSWAAQGQPHWLINEDVTLFRITPEDDRYNRIREYTYVPKDPPDDDYLDQQMTMTNVFSVGWSVYGPNSRSRSFLIFSRIFDPTVRELLRKQHIFLIPDVSAPVRAPELFEGQWWERTDVKAKYNELVALGADFPYIKSATVELVPEEGDGVIVHVEP